MSSTKNLSLTSIGFPRDYVRDEPDAQHVLDLREVCKAKGGKSYPFDTPIMVRALDKPRKYAATMGGKRGECEYELVKGLHRCLALKAEGYSAVTADVRSFTTDADAVFAQYDFHGVLKLTVPQRAVFIRRMRDEFKWKLEQIAEKLGMSAASISRILRDKQATGGNGKPRKPRASKSEGEGSESTESTFNVSEWYNIATELVNAYSANQAAVDAQVLIADPKLYAALVGIGQHLDQLATAQAGAETK